MSIEKLALYWDFENLHKCLRENGSEPINVEPLVDVRALMMFARKLGTVVVNRAYNHWSSYSAYRELLIELGIDLVQVYPIKNKNSADIRLVVDAMEDVFRQPEITQFVILSSDRDYTSLAHKLRKLSKSVVGIGIRKDTHDVWPSCCDAFHYYDQIVGGPLRLRPVQGKQLPAQPPVKVPTSPSPAAKSKATSPSMPAKTPAAAVAAKPATSADKDKAALILAESAWRLFLGNKSEAQPPALASKLREVDPKFSLEKHGYSGKGGFNTLLEDAEKRSLLLLDRTAQGIKAIKPGPELREGVRAYGKKFPHRVKTATKLPFTPNGFCHPTDQAAFIFAATVHVLHGPDALPIHLAQLPAYLRWVVGAYDLSACGYPQKATLKAVAQEAEKLQWLQTGKDESDRDVLRCSCTISVEQAFSTLPNLLLVRTHQALVAQQLNFQLSSVEELLETVALIVTAIHQGAMQNDLASIEESLREQGPHSAKGVVLKKLLARMTMELASESHTFEIEHRLDVEFLFSRFFEWVCTVLRHTASLDVTPSVVRIAMAGPPSLKKAETLDLSPVD